MKSSPIVDDDKPVVHTRNQQGMFLYFGILLVLIGMVGVYILIFFSMLAAHAHLAEQATGSNAIDPMTTKTLLAVAGILTLLLTLVSFLLHKYNVEILNFWGFLLSGIIGALLHVLVLNKGWEAIQYGIGKEKPIEEHALRRIVITAIISVLIIGFFLFGFISILIDYFKDQSLSNTGS